MVNASRIIAGYLALSAFALLAQSRSLDEPRLSQKVLAAQYFGADAPWFERNIPFLEIDDPEIQEIYYYRWKLFRSHIREIGSQGTTVLEFLDNVPWARQPYTDLNDSASFHILEGRWLRDASVVDSLIDHLYTGGANDRHFSESIAAATYSSTLVTGDPGPGARHLDTMEHIYNLWDDHFDRQRNLYWVEPLLDATEYTISSIDASGAGFTDTPSTHQNHNGFTGGFAFRPSINSYQYGNALAIAKLAALTGKPEVAADYERRADDIRAAVLAQLWNSSLQHFTDRYQQSTEFVKAGEFIRGRELVGYLPWFYELPPKDAATEAEYALAWKHLLSADELGGSHGLRTVEPSYPRYLAQYRYDQATGQPECQWNGPSWPFQTSQVLTALANVLDDYPDSGITRDDYVRLLRQYTQQHYLSPGYPDLQEDYNPDTGKQIVGLPRSHHYAHSTYVDLVLSGLIGIRPRADEVLEINPLLPVGGENGEKPISFFALEGLRYHGHEVGVIYDSDGGRYHMGRGFSVFVDGKRVFGPGPLDHVRIPLGPRVTAVQRAVARVDLAVNPGILHGTVASASSGTPESIAEAIDGRLWFFPEISNGWSPLPSDGGSSWYGIDFGQEQTIGSVELYFFSDGKGFEVPSKVELQYRTSAGWQDVKGQTSGREGLVANGETRFTFPPLRGQELRVVLSNPMAPAVVRLVEIEAFAP
jgi:hypothetical protein